MQKIANIKYLWGIEWDDKNSPDFLTLTWSSTLVDIDWFKGIIDFWMFQWWKADSTKNKEVPENLDKIDFVVLTHAHLDHSWRLPLLVKNGFNWPIYTTRLTWLQTKEMLLDYVKIMKAEISNKKLSNKKIFETINEANFLVKNFELLYNSSKISQEKRKKIQARFHKKFWDLDFNELEKKYLEAKKILEEIWDFEQKEVPELLFDEKDVEKTCSMFKFLENWDEITIKENFSLNFVGLNLEKLLDSWAHESDEKIFLPIEIYNKIKTELQEKIENTKKAISENKKISDENSIKREEFEWALDLLEAWHIWVELKNSTEKFLSENWIYSINDIDEALEPLYEIKYSLDNIYALNKKIFPITWEYLTEKEQNSNLIKSIKLRFFWAWHIEWSSQVILTIVSQSLKKVSNILEKTTDIPWFRRKTEKHTNLLFTWDLGRVFEPNLPWVPDKINFKIDYAQVESTYAWRSHIDREQTEYNFFREIEKSNWKIIIPAFSIQRTQEVLLMILNEMKKRLWDIEEFNSIKEKIKNLEEKKNNFSEKSWLKYEAILRTIKFLKNDLSRLSKSIVFQNIVVDSPLSIKITDIYKQDDKIKKKYALLDPKEQIKIFWKQVVYFIEWDEKSLLYEKKRKNRKEIIISSSGMCDWWSILYHLQNNLENPKSKILFVGYCPENTNWWKIKSWERILLNWKYFEPLCEIADLPGFSAHLDEEEILEHVNWINFKNWAKISLTHWWTSRLELSNAVSELVNSNAKKVEVIVPKLGDEVKIKI